MTAILAIVGPLLAQLVQIITDAVTASKATDADALARLRATLAAAVAQVDADLALLADARVAADAEIAAGEGGAAVMAPALP